jgi:hypothetical protein
MIARIPKIVQVTSEVFQHYLRFKEADDVVFSFKSDDPECNFVPVTVEISNSPENFTNFYPDVPSNQSFVDSMTLYGPVLVKDSQLLYIGQFVDNLRHGYGLLVFSDGSFFEGNFANDNLNGLGTMFYPDGSYYHGNFKESEKYGNGTFYGTNQEIVKGYFKKNIITGQATVIYPDKAQYVGELTDYKKEGTGKFIFQNEDFYEGTFKDDLFEGKGRFHRKKDDTVFEGNWQMNQLINPCKIYYANLSLYEGEVFKFLKHGEGRLKEFEKTYEGVWENDLKEGVFRISTEGSKKHKIAQFSKNTFQKFLSDKTPVTFKISASQEERSLNAEKGKSEKIQKQEKGCRCFCL